ncbi:hypothetical protein WA026_012969 [Henosepilachna vigintioctopunctata]|uniref:Uncharacterized protein n=1 Tax=Henosepilachna vigintioctopunctata TaxID=420089 RepID=A0AAW1TWQ2_9CUCU
MKVEEKKLKNYILKLEKSNSELEKELTLLTNKGTEYTSTINSSRNDIEKLESANKNITEENKQCLEEMVLLKSEVNELKYMTVNRKLMGSNDKSINEELHNKEMELTIDENVSRRMSEVETRLYDKLFRNLKESVLAEIKDKTFPPTSKKNVSCKLRLPPIYGSKTGSGHLKAYIPVSSIHISKVRLENDDKDIIEYIKTHIPHIPVSCTELKVRSGQYRSFKVGVPASISSQILNSNFWPEHLVVKRFLEPKGNFWVKGNDIQKN